MKKQMSELVQRSIRLGVDAGIFPRHRKFQKYIILGQGRTGSNFLASLLRSHGQVVAFGELFNKAPEGRLLWEYPGYRSTFADCELRRKDPIGFLGQRVFGPQPLWVKAVGFKLFYHHARENWSAIWPYLQSLPDLKVIHLSRRNLLRRFLSLEIAKRTGQWSINDTAQSTDGVSVELDYTDLERSFFATNEAKEAHLRLFGTHAVVEVNYEDLVGDSRREMEKIQDFLSVSPRPLISQTVKQSRIPLSQAISNYFLLKKRFAGTQWSAFFDD